MRAEILKTCPMDFLKEDVKRLFDKVDRSLSSGIGACLPGFGACLPGFEHFIYFFSLCSGFRALWGLISLSPVVVSSVFDKVCE